MGRLLVRVFRGTLRRAMRPIVQRVEMITVSRGSTTPRRLRKESQRHSITTTTGEVDIKVVVEVSITVGGVVAEEDGDFAVVDFGAGFFGFD